MSLITTEFVKTKFPQWEKYCETSEVVLQSEIDDAEAVFLFYVNVNAVSITNFLKLLLLILVKKECFDLLHGDKEFEHRPQILKDYDKALQTLQAIKDGVLSVIGTSISQSNSITMTADTKVFDTWFNSKTIDISQMEDQYE